MLWLRLWEEECGEDRMMPRSMRLAAAIATAGFILAQHQPAAAQASPGAESPQAVLDRFAAAFATRDVEAVAALFASDATFFGSTFHGSVDAPPLRGPEGARAYFGRAWSDGVQRVMSCRTDSLREPAPGVALAAAVCRLERSRPDGSVVPSTLRASAALVRGEAGWRFADLHVSVSPPAPSQPQQQR